ncbi:MAG: hypothetical protein ACRDI2_18325, partial [Chloroflexota bacterium]
MRSALIRGALPQIQALCREHWSLLLILAAGLALRLPYLHHGHWGDILGVSRFATTLVTPGRWLDAYHNGFIHAYPYAHPPFGPILFAPFNWLALTLGQPYTPAYHLLIYAFEAAAAVFLYLLARGFRGAPTTPALVAGFWFLAPLTLLWLPARDAPPDTHFTSVASAFVLAALWRKAHSTQAGALFGLALATRTESAFLALPWMLHYARTSWRDAAVFAAVTGAVCGGIVLPFMVRDPVAFDWALRGHIMERLSQETPLLWRWLEADGTEMGRRVVEVVRPRNSLVMALGILGATILFRRDPWLERYLLLVGLTHILLMPVFHTRYGLYVLALGLAYVARAGAPHLLVLWSLATTRLGHTALTIGLPWLALGWQSACAPPLRREGADPYRARVLQLLRSAPWRVPSWAPPLGMVTICGVIALSRIEHEPRADGSLLLLRTLGEPAGGPHVAAAGWLVRFVALGTLAWRVNAVPVMAGLLASLLAGAAAGGVFERLRSRPLAHPVAGAACALTLGLTGALVSPDVGDSYRSLAIDNLQELERGALI